MKRLLLIPIVIVVVAGGLAIYFFVLKDDSQVNQNQNANVNQALQNSNLVNAVQNANTTSNANTTAADDADGDGLTTAEELKYSTDPNLFDTDMDGYTDKTEIDGGYSPLKGSAFVFYNVSAQEPTPLQTQNINGQLTGVVVLEELEPIANTDTTLEFLLQEKCIDEQDSGVQFGEKQWPNGQTYEYCQLPADMECNPRAFLFNQCVFADSALSTAEDQAVEQAVLGYTAETSCFGEISNYVFNSQTLYQATGQNGYYMVYAVGDLLSDEGQVIDSAPWLLILNDQYQVIGTYHHDEIPEDPVIGSDGSLENVGPVFYC